MNFETLTAKITNGKTLDFGSILNRSFELFKKVWLQGFLTLLLTLALILPFYLLYYLPFIVAGITDPRMFEYEELSPFLAVSMTVFFPFLLVAALTVGVAMNAAFLRICAQKDVGSAESDDYFYFFKQGRWKKGLVLGLIILGLAILGMLLCGVGFVYLIVPMSLIPAIYAFNEELTALEITKASFKLGHKNWLVVFGLIIVMGIVAELGIILCGIGILFTAMMAKIPAYFIYMDGVGSPNSE